MLIKVCTTQVITRLLLVLPNFEYVNRVLAIIYTILIKYYKKICIYTKYNNLPEDRNQ